MGVGGRRGQTGLGFRVAGRSFAGPPSVIFLTYVVVFDARTCMGFAVSSAVPDARLSKSQESSFTMSRTISLGKRAPAALALVLGLGGCYLAGSKAHFTEAGLPKAAFDMHCDKEKLDVTELAHGSMGVQGCGKQARYEYINGSGWVLNASEGMSEK